jgi:hypothetical protein
MVRTPLGRLIFFVRRVTAELLGLQVARYRARGYMDAPALGLDEGLAYLRHEIASRAPHQH